VQFRVESISVLQKTAHEAPLPPSRFSKEIFEKKKFPGEVRKTRKITDKKTRASEHDEDFYR
jgi:hypothetical protein